MGEQEQRRERRHEEETNKIIKMFTDVATKEVEQREKMLGIMSKFFLECSKTSRGEKRKKRREREEESSSD